MSILNTLKLDSWWKILLWLGVALIFVVFRFAPEFIEKRHLFGLGFGMIIVGLSYFAAQEWRIKPPNAYTGGVAQYVVIKHTPGTKLFLVIELTAICRLEESL